MISKEQFREIGNSLISDEDRREYNKKASAKNSIIKIAIPIESVATIGLLIAGIILLATSGFLGLQLIMSALFLALFCLGLDLVLIRVFGTYKWKQFKETYCQQLVEKIFEEYNCQFNANDYIYASVYNESNFGSSDYNRYGGEDLLTIDIPNSEGKPSDTKFRMSDISAIKKEMVIVTDNDGNQHEEEKTTVCYSGAFGYARFTRPFKCNLSINTWLTFLNKIKLEDIDFNKNFKVRTDNQVEALCILTPTVIMRLKSLHEHFDKVMMSFSGDTLYIGFPHTNLFEIGGGKTLDGTAFDNFYDDCANILYIVEEIANNDKIYKKD